MMLTIATLEATEMTDSAEVPADAWALLLLCALLAGCDSTDTVGDWTTPQRKPRVHSPYALRSAADSAYQRGYDDGHAAGWSLGYTSHVCIQ
jgi:hypothetical protein